MASSRSSRPGAQPELGSKDGCRLRGIAGRSRMRSRRRRPSLGSITTRRGPGMAGIGTSRWRCWLLPCWPWCAITRTSSRLPKKRRAGLAGPRADPLVCAGDPARGDALGPTPHPPGPRDRLVVMAPRPSGRRPKRSPKTTTVVLGRVDGFDDDEAEGESHEGSEVLVGFLATERDALEALELADQLLDAGAGAVERLRKESGPVSGRGLERDHRADAPFARGRAIARAVVSFVPHRSPRRDVRPEVKQDLELRTVARLTLCEVEGERQAI